MRTHTDDHGDVVCEHGTAVDVHCCNCHSGFLFDAERCTCGSDWLTAVIEQHARIAVLPIQSQHEAYEPTPDETNALKNIRHILSRFADELLREKYSLDPQVALDTKTGIL